MRVLELDAGNSRLKWRLVDRLAGEDVRRLSEGFLSGAGAEEKWLFDELIRQLPEVPERILVSSVCTEGFEQALADRLQEYAGVRPDFARVAKRCAGVEVAYTEPARLGVDRWLAMLAAYQYECGACCVLDCGTTITLDVVSANGSHRGGYIVPGFNLMRESLVNRSAVLVHSEEVRSFLPGINTGEAISHGLLAMVLGFIGGVRERLSAEGLQESWYLTGGDADLLKPYIGWGVELRGELVLDGLQLALSGEGSLNK